MKCLSINIILCLFLLTSCGDFENHAILGDPNEFGFRNSEPTDINEPPEADTQSLEIIIKEINETTSGGGGGGGGSTSESDDPIPPPDLEQTYYPMDPSMEELYYNEDPPEEVLADLTSSYDGLDLDYDELNTSYSATVHHCHQKSHLEPVKLNKTINLAVMVISKNGKEAVNGDRVGTDAYYMSKYFAPIGLNFVVKK